MNKKEAVIILVCMMIICFLYAKNEDKGFQQTTRIIASDICADIKRIETLFGDIENIII